MNSLQLEQLISGYVDGELSQNRKQEVELLLQSDPAAKKLYDEFMAIRNEFRQIQRRNLPHDFQKKLFERIDKETVPVSGKLVEQTTSVDFTLPPTAELPQKRQQGKNQKTSIWSAGLKKPPLLAASAAILLICATVFVRGVLNPNAQTAFVPPVEPGTSTQEGSTAEVEVIPSSLPGAGTLPGDVSLRSLAMKDGKPILEVPCRLSKSARDNEFVPTLLADQGYSYFIRENGNKNVTVYEFELPLKELLPFILMMNSNIEEFKSYELPTGVVNLLNRPSESADNGASVPPMTAVIVRLNVTKEP